MHVATGSEHGESTQPAPSALRGNLALAMLFMIGTLNFIDRQLLAVLVEPIRAELHFSDTQFGLLTGLAFALFYAAMGVPVAMIADRWNRIRLIGICCLVWSGFTAACGTAGSFVQLALLRFGVGAGEAGGTAPSLSVISDYFPADRRPLAIAVFTLNGPFGVFAGAALGGFAASNFGWRGAFYMAGLLGLIAVPLLLWLVREPGRGQLDAASPQGTALPFRESLALFVRSRSLRLLLISSGLAAFVSYGMLNWIPAFLMRSQGMPVAALAKWFAPVAGATFGIGMIGGGWIVSRLARRSPRAYGIVPAVASAVVVPALIAALMVDGWQASLALMTIPMAACVIYVAPALALVQNLTPPRSRATASAVIMLMFNIVGVGLGPLFVGAASDALSPSMAEDSLRWALMALVPFVAGAGIMQFAMSRHLEHDFRSTAAPAAV